jgi:hypothetical protein
MNLKKRVLKTYTIENNLMDASENEKFKITNRLGVEPRSKGSQTPVHTQAVPQ